METILFIAILFMGIGVGILGGSIVALMIINKNERNVIPEYMKQTTYTGKERR